MIRFRIPAFLRAASILAAAVASAALLPHLASAQVDDAGELVFLPDAECCDMPAGDLLRYGHSLAIGDFNGDSHAELVIGVPGATHGGVDETGAVVVVVGTAAGPTGSKVVLAQTDFIGGVETYGDRFGWSFAVGRFDADACDDLAIGAPFDTPNEDGAAGQVYVVYGCQPGGLFRNDRDVYKLGNTLGLGYQQVGDHFGSGLAAGDFDDDGLDDLAIGADGEGVGGAVVVLYGHPNGTGLSTLGDQHLHRGASPIPGAAQAGEAFGRRLAVGDFDGDGVDDLVIAAPEKTIDGIEDVGSVIVVKGSQAEGGLDLDSWATELAQGSGLVGAPEPYGGLGSSLAVGDFNGDGNDDLAIGSPLEDVANGAGPQLPYAGAVNLVYGESGTGLAGPGTIFTQSSLIYLGAQAGDLFAFALAAGDLDGDGADDLAVGAPGESMQISTPGGPVEVSSIGTVQVVPGHPGTGLVLPETQHWIGSPAGFGAGDAFGGALAIGQLGRGGAEDLVAVSTSHVEDGETVGRVELLFSVALFADGFESGDTSRWQ